VYGAVYWLIWARHTFKGPQRRAGDLPPLTEMEMAAVAEGRIAPGGGGIDDDGTTTEKQPAGADISAAMPTLSSAAAVDIGSSPRAVVPLLQGTETPTASAGAGNA
jgi:hypothetical protein